MLGDNVALVGEDAPFARRKRLDVGDAGMPIDLRPKLAGPGRHGIRHVRRGDMPVMDGPECRLHPEWIEERVVFLDLVRADDFAFISGEPGDAVDAVEPVDLLVGPGNAQTPPSIPRYGLPPQLLELPLNP